MSKPTADERLAVAFICECGEKHPVPYCIAKRRTRMSFSQRERAMNLSMQVYDLGYEDGRKTEREERERRDAASVCVDGEIKKVPGAYVLPTREECSHVYGQDHLCIHCGDEQPIGPGIQAAEHMQPADRRIMDAVRRAMVAEARWWDRQIRQAVEVGYKIEDMELIENSDDGTRKLMAGDIPLVVVRPESRWWIRQVE